MIKLNNKNITYVALADSSNSLKAPKEIWYADSNNSVKLVYRRKDALIEGEDYEKYHWLKGDGSAYIDTNIKNLTNVHYIDILISVDGIGPSSGSYFFGRESVAPYYNSQVVLYYVLTRQNISVWANNVGHEINFADIVGNVTLNFDTNIASTPTDSVGFSVSNYNSAFSIFLFANNSNGNPVQIFTGKIRKLEIDDITHFVPCKLLKPVPKWLDANGIRRQVGECGMIDLVSGKFYGNVNSVGTFTVENYYERKEWLCGDGSAYIDTLIEDLTELNEIYCYFYSDNPSENERIFGREGLSRVVLRYSAMNSLEFFVSPSNNPQYIVLNFNREGYFHADFTTNQASTSTSEPTSFVWNTSKSGNSVILFGDHSAAVLPHTSAKIKSFKMEPFIKLIPCTLTMDLPASMDANNIARTKGTCGMWDLVSDRFYGNVANSGTFKAVNLAEGVDYEVHDWLVGDGSAYIDTLIYDLTGKSIYCKLERNAEITNWTTTRILGREGDSRFVVTYANTSYTTNIILWTQNRSYAPRFTTTEGWIRINFEDNLVETHQSSESIETYTIKSSNLSIILFGDRLSTTTVSRIYKGKIGQLTVNQAMNLIPVKLLRSIPAKYDANGISRQANECGMYDTVNDVFYGNVASSGTFSVSD